MSSIHVTCYEELRTKARDYLESQGYVVAESRRASVPVDLVAIPTGVVSKGTIALVRFVQVKYGRSITDYDRARLREFVEKLGNKRVLVEIWCYCTLGAVPTVEEIE